MTVNLMGGLGNQLFQWAAGAALSSRLGTSLVLNGEGIGRENDLLDKRIFELNYFSLAEGRRQEPKISLPFPFRLNSNRVFKEASFRFDPTFEKVYSAKTLKGYFQSWKYFDGVSSDIRSTLIAGAQPTSAYHQVLREMGDKPWVAVHVRRGDYVNFPNMFVLLGSEYYSRALSLLKRSGDYEIVVFCEDLRGVEKLVPGAHMYVDRSMVSAAGDVLMLLGKASAVVGANSSLSWWGAFLNQSDPAKKVFPSDWFGLDGSTTEDLIPQDWSVI